MTIPPASLRSLVDVIAAEVVRKLEARLHPSVLLPLPPVPANDFHATPPFDPAA